MLRLLEPGDEASDSQLLSRNLRKQAKSTDESGCILEEKMRKNKIYKLKDNSLFKIARQDPTIMVYTVDLDPTTEVQMAPVFSTLLMFWKVENGRLYRTGCPH